MGDIPTGSLPLGNCPSSPQIARGAARSDSNPPFHEDDATGSGSGHASQGGFTPMYPYSQQQHPSQMRQEPYNMTALGTALPDMSYQSLSSHQRFTAGSAPSPLPYQLPNAQQYTGGSMNLPSNNMPYNFPYQSQYQGMYIPPQAQQAQSVQSSPNPSNQFYQSHAFVGQHPQTASPFFVQPNQYIQPSQVFAGNPVLGQYTGRGGFLGDHRHPQQQRGNEQFGQGPSGSSQARSSSIASSTGQSSVVRGPPRKPRQSGHAIWIGNLPPQTDLMSLVLHVCKETSGLESLFLISKSNCAFANFRDESSCSAAQMKIHDSRFQTVRLVSRLRRSSAGASPGVSVPTGPAALAPSTHTTDETIDPKSSNDTDNAPHESIVDVIEAVAPPDESASAKDKFFVVKSLTVEDLELSVRNGIWATQSHNEDALNKAFETAGSVYLIFSANKSGEYFGYARMISPINDDPAAAIEFAPKAQTVEDPELPKAIPTPATEFAPKGRIIDDSARGTIFWEAERDEGDGVEEEEEEIQSNRSEQDEPASPSKAWGKPFKVEWISTTRLPFYRTRGLRNPWNSNREVKIARDGTELETAIGQRLLGLFHRLPSPSAPTHMQAAPMQLLGGGVGGYPQMHQFP